MKKFTTLIFLSAFALLAGCKPEQTALVSPLGFSIEAPKADAVVPHKIIDFSLPPQNGIATHVNVEIQTYEKSFDEFIADSIKQVNEQKNCTPAVISEKKSDDGSWTIEYKVTYKTVKPAAGVVLHQGAKSVNPAPDEVAMFTYIKAIPRGKLMYLAGGTVIDKNYEHDFPKVKACVDSFKLTEPAAEPENKKTDADESEPVK